MNFKFENFFSRRLKSKNLFVFFIIFIFLFFGYSSMSTKADNSEIDKLNQEIQAKKDYIEKLEKEKAKYEESIEVKQGEILNLNSELKILENQINKTKVKIDLIEAQIEQKNKEIEKIIIEIKLKEGEIASQKDKLSEVVRMIYQNSQKNYLEIILISESLSDFFGQWQYQEKLQEVLQKDVDKLQVIKQSLETQQSDLESKKVKLVSLQDALIKEQENFEEQENLKISLLNKTRGAEKKFQSMLADIRAEYNQANAEIASLETEVRKKLALQKKEFSLNGNVSMIWPVPSRIITASFHDPDYPMKRWLGEHPAIDIRAKQGTSVLAAEGGYVARAKDAGMGYSYIMIIHSDEISTVYGHLSKIKVQEDTYVTQGQEIGLSGGLPGTPGAGRFTLGPHLHFEVRVDGFPVNPEDYLP